VRVTLIFVSFMHRNSEIHVIMIINSVHLCKIELAEQIYGLIIHTTLLCTILLILAVILRRLVKWVIGFFQSTDGLRVENDAIRVCPCMDSEGERGREL
jgi:hypothetical protein